jgi:hypothetical protein
MQAKSFGGGRFSMPGIDARRFTSAARLRFV